MRSTENLPSVLRAMRDEDERVRRLAAPLLERISPEHSARELPTWIAMLRSGWLEEVLTAAEVLERIGPAAREAAPALREALERQTYEPVKKRLRDVLAAIDPE